MGERQTSKCVCISVYEDAFGDGFVGIQSIRMCECLLVCGKYLRMLMSEQFVL